MAMVMLLLLGYRIVLFWVGAMTSMTEEVRGRIFLGALFLNGGKMIGRTKREMENGGKNCLANMWRRNSRDEIMAGRR